MAETTPFDIDHLFDGSLRVLRTEAEYFSRLTDHNPELGRLNESHLLKLLRAYLPQKIGIGTGFIASGGRHRQQSPQCDIILYDDLNNAPLHKSEAWSIYPIETVYGIIEVKTTLNGKTLSDAFGKCAKVRAMAKTPDGEGNKAYVTRQSDPGPQPLAMYRPYLDGIPPRFFVFGYNGWKRESYLAKNFRSATQDSEGAHIHGVCNLYDGGSLFMGHIAYAKGEERFSAVAKNGFHIFLMQLPKLLDSMLPVHRNGLGFDLVNLDHYVR